MAATRCAYQNSKILNFHQWGFYMGLIRDSNHGSPVLVFLFFLCYQIIMAPKRKATKSSRQSAKRPHATSASDLVSKEDLVASVVEQLKPIINDAVQQALPQPPTLTPAESTQPADDLSRPSWVT